MMDESAIAPGMITRDELYALGWSEPMIRTVERFGVTAPILTRGLRSAVGKVEPDEAPYRKRCLTIRHPVVRRVALCLLYFGRCVPFVIAQTRVATSMRSAGAYGRLFGAYTLSTISTVFRSSRWVAVK